MEQWDYINKSFFEIILLYIRSIFLITSYEISQQWQHDCDGLKTQLYKEQMVLTAMNTFEILLKIEKLLLFVTWFLH